MAWVCVYRNSSIDRLMRGSSHQPDDGPKIVAALHHRVDLRDRFHRESDSALKAQLAARSLHVVSAACDKRGIVLRIRASALEFSHQLPQRRPLKLNAVQRTHRCPLLDEGASLPLR